MSAAPIRTLADLVNRLGGVPLGRIRFHPPPGTATVQDVLDVDAKEDRVCELVDGVLVEKAGGFTHGILSVCLGAAVGGFVRARNLGLVTGFAGTMQLHPGLVRIPDLAFVGWGRVPGRRCPVEPAPVLVPNLAVEVLSLSNTAGEMALKRQDYFTAGVELVWEVDPELRTVSVYTSPTGPTVLGVGQVLTGGTVLPGFTLPVADLFTELDRQG
jgi:Uma2 family endonuclease